MGQKETPEKESWDAFFSTGKVEDYLRYASCKEGSSLKENTERVGDRTYAGFCSGNRDYTEAEPYRGIR